MGNNTRTRIRVFNRFLIVLCLLCLSVTLDAQVNKLVDGQNGVSYDAGESVDTLCQQTLTSDLSTTKKKGNNYSERLPLFIIGGSVGTGRILSNIDSPFGKPLGRKNEVEMSLALEGLVWKGMGVGLEYNSLKADYGDEKITLSLIAPSIGWTQFFTKCLVGSIHCGIGYTFSSDNYFMGKTGVGCFGRSEMSYLIDDIVAIGAYVGVFKHNLEKPEGYRSSNEKYYHVRRISFGLSVRMFLGQRSK